jgi:hypothetical protein
MDGWMDGWMDGQIDRGVLYRRMGEWKDGIRVWLKTCAVQPNTSSE